MRKEWPTVILDETEFIVDVKKLELREKADRKNFIPFDEMDDIGNGYRFECMLKDQNYFKEFKMPEWVMLDPIGMAKKYGFTLIELVGKSDFEVMVDQNAYDLRVNKGQLPTVKIAGHIFYVDMRMDMLRPKDEFLSKGIPFSKIDHYFEIETDGYVIPYNPKTFEFEELDDKITEYPKHLIAVELPEVRSLDPVGWNREHGYDLKYRLKEIGLRPHFKAKIIPWEKTGLHYLINDNLKKLEEKNRKTKPSKKEDQASKKGRGRRM